jgi:hypothetical protein
VTRVCLIAALALSAVSCGYVGDPLPPALNIPQPVQDLKLQQVESRLEAAFTIPPKTTENLPITAIATVELRIGRMPRNGWNVDEWAAAAKPIAVDASEPGPVETSADIREFANSEIVAAVRMANKKGRASAWSNFVTVRIEPPVVTPAGFLADSAPNGALLTWQGHPGPVVVFRNGEPIGEGAAGRFLDPRALLGRTYEYQIQARGNKAFGRKSAPQKLTVIDRFPPAPPTGLNLAAGANTVELSWSPNPESDILSYTVFRASGSGPFTQVASSLDAPAFTDRDVKSGIRYRYKVAALDLRNNQSPNSQEVEITVP